MTPVKIQAYEDRSRPAGGHAVICLQGIADVPQNAAFTLEPVDAATNGRDLAYWPKGELLPIEIRRGDAGVELVVGPGVVDSPMLVAGTPVRIALPHAAMNGEFLWPSIAPTARPRRRSLLAGRTTLDAPSAAGTEPHRSLGASAVQPNARLPAPSSEPHEDPVMADRRADDAPRMTPKPTVSNAQGTAAASPILRAGPVQSADPAGDRDPVETADGVFYAHARGGTIRVATDAAAVPARGITDLLPQSRLGAAGVAMAALLAVQATAYMMLASRSSVNLAALPSSVQAPVTPASGASPYEALAVGDVSPLGVRASAVAPARQLELANASLFAEGALRDTEEAAFWLKRHLATTASDDGFRRSLTQLGSTYAAPSRGVPDYGRARQVWEIAAAYGDTVAICFLARLHDSGLVANSDPDVARKWHDRAQSAGGCSRRDGAATVK